MGANKPPWSQGAGISAQGRRATANEPRPVTIAGPSIPTNGANTIVPPQSARVAELGVLVLRLHGRLLRSAQAARHVAQRPGSCACSLKIAAHEDPKSVRELRSMSERGRPTLRRTTPGPAFPESGPQRRTRPSRATPRLQTSALANTMAGPNPWVRLGGNSIGGRPEGGGGANNWAQSPEGGRHEIWPETASQSSDLDGHCLMPRSRGDEHHMVPATRIIVQIRAL